MFTIEAARALVSLLNSVADGKWKYTLEVSPLNSVMIIQSLNVKGNKYVSAKDYDLPLINVSLVGMESVFNDLLRMSKQAKQERGRHE